MGNQVIRIQLFVAFDIGIDDKPIDSASDSNLTVIILRGKGANRTSHEETRFQKLKGKIAEYLISEEETQIERETRAEIDTYQQERAISLQRKPFGGGND